MNNVTQVIGFVRFLWKAITDCKGDVKPDSFNGRLLILLIMHFVVPFASITMGLCLKRIIYGSHYILSHILAMLDYFSGNTFSRLFDRWQLLPVSQTPKPFAGRWYEETTTADLTNGKTPPLDHVD